MSHEQMRELYFLHALGLLEGEERGEIERHLAENCATCASEMRLAAAANADILCGAPRVSPPATLRGRVLFGFVSQKPGWLFWAPWAVACVAILLALGVSLTYRPQPQPSQAALNFLRQPGNRQIAFGGKPGAPRGTLYLHQRNGVLLLVDQMPAAPAGHIYETWYVPKQGAPQPIGPLATNANGSAVAIMPGPIDPATLAAVAVSLEPDTKPPVAPTTVVFVAPLGN
jgi:hypothetical protein